MKNITDYIIESLVVESKDVWSLSGKEKAEMITILDKTFNKLSKDRIFSLMNKTDRAKIYQVLKEQSGAEHSQFMMNKIASYGFKDPDSFAKFIINNYDQFIKNKFKIDWVLQWNETEAEKKYNEWKKSKDYVESVDDKDCEERDLVIYDRWNPEVHATYPFKGKRGKSTDHQINMLRLDFHYDFDVKYYDCYSILAKNYFGHEEELKKRAEYQLGFDDPNEFK